MKRQKEKTRQEPKDARAGIITDPRTGLEWYEGPDIDTNWKHAKRWVENLTVDGGWRMPNRSELKGLYREEEGSLNRDPAFKTTGSWVWSGETHGSSLVLLIDFVDGDVFSRIPDDAYYRRAFAVRSRDE